MKFKIQAHTHRPGVQVVEVFDEKNRFVATIMPGKAPGMINVVSKHIAACDMLGPTPLLPVSVVVVSLTESRDPPAKLDRAEIELEAAVMNLQRVMMLTPGRQRAILVKKTAFEILPAEVTVEAAQEMKGVEIIAVADNLEVPTHLAPDAPTVEKSGARATETTVDEVTIKCPSCGEEHGEIAWKGNAGACPGCNIPPENAGQVR